MVGPEDVFGQCHEHLRIIEQRRDIAVGVLFTFVIAVFALLVQYDAPQVDLKLTANAKLTGIAQLTVIAKLAVIAIAIGVFALLGSLRRWKLIHMDAASVFMRISSEQLPTREGASEIWNGIMEARARDRLTRGAIRGTRIWSSSIDHGVLFISAAVSACIAVPCFASVLVGFELKTWASWTVAFVAWFVFAFLLCWFTEARDRSFPHYAWMFQGLSDSPPGSEEPHDRS